MAVEHDDIFSPISRNWRRWTVPSVAIMSIRSVICVDGDKEAHIRHISVHILLVHHRMRRMNKHEDFVATTGVVVQRLVG